MNRAALLSVSDKTGLEEFANVLANSGFVLLATSGTRAFLTEKGISTVSIEEYTAQREILDGRVKTLHPKIHAGLLAKRDDPTHVRELEENGIYSIEIAVINLYPFISTLEQHPNAPLEKMIEYIDIGGPTMIRAAAKNSRHVVPVIDPQDYSLLAGYLERGESIPLSVRTQLAAKVFTCTANYDLEIAKYLAQNEQDTQEELFGPVHGLVLRKEQSLRYGENPHQGGAFYRPAFGAAPRWVQLNGKELSYNNLLDFDAALGLARTLPQTLPGAVIVKHLNPCGAACADDLLTALRSAKRGDPRSHFGGVLAFTREVDEGVAEAIREDFAEIVIAPSYSVGAVELLRKSKNLRVLQAPFDSSTRVEIRAVEGGYLLQERDPGAAVPTREQVVSERAPSESELEDLAFAWSLCAHVKSNAIVLVKDQTLIGTGAGQMSRIDSVELALSKAQRHGHEITGAVAASDAFFPFPDSVETLAQHGVRCIVAPRGAKRDDEVIAAANRAGVALLFTEYRHFRH
jgi:phosphoribosylaminoimidazolecarboxamide formyltransferase / IMP cyclohydrolase